MNLGVAPSESDERYSRSRAALITYLKHKVDIADWHGASDACNDLRVLEAEHSAQILLREGLNVPVS
jgi:hypothetical protein